MTTTPLAQHVGHRCIPLDGQRLRCHDCARTVVLPTTGVAARSTSTSTSPPLLHAPDRCPAHPGQTRRTCGPCRAEQLERTTDPPPFAPAAEVTCPCAGAGHG